MVLIDFVKRASPRDLRRMALLTTVAGFANAFLVVVVNQVAGLVADGARPGIWLWAAFVLAFALYFLCDKRALLLSNGIIEGLLRDLRLSVVAKLRRAELPTVDGLGRGHLYTMVAQETNHLSVTFPLLIESFQQAVLMSVSLIYLGYLSWPALAVFGVAVLLGILGYLRINENFRDTLQRLTGRQAQMLDAIVDIIDGGKELRLNSRRSNAVYQAYQRISQAGQVLLTRSGEHWAEMILLSGFVVYFMLGVVGFIFPRYIDQHSTIVFQLVPTLLFCIGPLTRIVAQSPMFVRADVGLHAILAVEQQLDAGPTIEPARARELAAQYRNFQHIAYRGLSFSYRDKAGQPVFTAGPLDLAIASGEILFLVGGNGSGKSTTLRLMTALYPAEQGEILVDGVALQGEAIGGFRELFSAIFADFHLFDRLYGLEQVDVGEVERLIEEMGLAGKVRYVDGRFSDLNLSTGQRKRLALIAALLEDRPIYVFDEWSAEQDIHFRRYFYTRILPELKARGKTVVVVSHDDRFWHLADRVVKLDLGRVEWERLGRDLEDKS
ncbi:MAG: putative fused multidrug transport subunit of superfamily transporter: permease [Proteobacteria bacterium]|nr:putative fused multidrug transport subunit of superfamily transporter: permease [Pseudomonadota bacterium]